MQKFSPLVIYLLCPFLHFCSIFIYFFLQATDAMRKIENFRNKNYFIAHGTLDGKYQVNFKLQSSKLNDIADHPVKDPFTQ